MISGTEGLKLPCPLDREAAAEIYWMVIRAITELVENGADESNDIVTELLNAIYLLRNVIPV